MNGVWIVLTDKIDNITFNVDIASLKNGGSEIKKKKINQTVVNKSSRGILILCSQ